MMDALNQQVAVRVICLVPEWRLWRWAGIRQWKNPRPTSFSVTYLPVPYLPVLGRNLSAFFYRWVLERQVTAAADETVYAAWLFPDAVAVAEWAGEPDEAHGAMRDAYFDYLVCVRVRDTSCNFNRRGLIIAHRPVTETSRALSKGSPETHPSEQ
jgi:hypothetical protein